MPEAQRSPAPYRAPLRTRLLEGLRYGGGIGQWSWLLHRVTGLGIAAFLTIHILDTFFVVFNPELYDHTVAIYGGVLGGQYYWLLRWAFRFGELGLIACVLFHAVNGVRIILFDFWPASMRLQKELGWAVVTVFAVLMLPIAIAVFLPLIEAPDSWRVPEAESNVVVATPPPGPTR